MARQTSRVAMFGATAQGMMKMTAKSKVDALRHVSIAFELCNGVDMAY
jgi:hypothetical protein